MDVWKRLCNHPHTEDKIVSSLEECGLIAVLKDAAVKEVIKPSVSINNLEESVYDTITKSGEPYTVTIFYLMFMPCSTANSAEECRVQRTVLTPGEGHRHIS